MADQETITNLSELGEFALIDKLVKNVKIYNDSTLKAVGDDAAFVPVALDARCRAEVEVLIPANGNIRVYAKSL